MLANDYPSLNFALGETADLLRETVRDFAAAEVAPLAEADRPRQCLPGRAVAQDGRCWPIGDHR